MWGIGSTHMRKYVVLSSCIRIPHDVHSDTTHVLQG